MSDLPAYPDTDEHHPDVTADAPDGSRRRRVAVIAGVLALVVLFVVLHLTGVVGAESH